MKTQPTLSKAQYKQHVSYMTHPELMAEHESLKDLCKHLSYENRYHTLKRIAQAELIDRGLEALS